MPLILMVALGTCLQMRHQYWFEKDQPPLNGNNDDKWFYCDEKCLELERKVKDKDFVVVKFHERWKEPFSACYMKSGKQYLLWSKVVNSLFYEKHCGSDYKDWHAEGFPVTGVYGVGIGAPLNSTAPA